MPRGKKWALEELEFLDDLAGRYPLQIITKKINNWHRKNKTQIKRTQTAVKIKMMRCNYSATPSEDNMSFAGWAKELRIEYDRVRSWTRYSDLPYKKIARNKCAISIENMKIFAMQRPFLFSDVQTDILLYYFGEAVTDLIVANKPLREKMVGNKPVTRIDTGEIYAGIRQASRQTGIPRPVIKREAKRIDGWLKFVK